MAWYKTGTVTVTNNSATVLGNGTTFMSSIAAGDLFTADGDKVYEVASVIDNTTFTLGKVYSGATASGATYQIARLSTVSITTVGLANQVSALLTSWQVRENEYKVWTAGNALSGFRSDGTPASPAGADSLAGYYPLSDLTGAVTYVACPAKRAPADAPTFTGTVTLPATTSIGNVSAAEIGYLDGVTSAVQTQFNAKAPLASPALTGVPTAPTAATGTDTTQLATAALVKATGDTKALLAGSATQDFAAKVLTATTVNANNIGGITHSQGIVTTYAASGATGIQTPNNDNLNFGTGDFTLVWRGSLPDWTPSAVTHLIRKYNAGVGLFVRVNADGTLLIVLTGAGNVSKSFYTPVLGFVDGTVHKITVCVIRETASVAGSVLTYIDGLLFDTEPIAAGINGSLTNTGAFYISGYDAARDSATTQTAYAYNRALSDAEVLSLYRYGVAESDKWGSQTELSYGAWINTYTTPWPVFSSTLSSSMSASDSVGSINIRWRITAATTVGKRYKMSFVPTFSGATVTSINNSNAFSGVGIIVTSPVLVSGQQYTLDFMSKASIPADAIMFIATTTAGAALDITNFTIVELGATLALEPEGIQPAPGQWLDSSTNKLHALQPATGSSLSRKKENFELRWTNTWAGTHEAQYVGGINQVVLPPNCYIESIIGVVTGTVIEDIILGDGVDTDRWVTITTGLATGTQTFAIANRVSDGTNRKLVVDPDANFTGSISWVIKGMIL